MIKQFLVFNGNSGTNYLTWTDEDAEIQTDPGLITGFLTAVTHFTQDVFEGKFQSLDLGNDVMFVTGKEMQI